jgi:hypothetical protein
MQLMEVLRNTNQDLWPEDSHKKREFSMMRHLIQKPSCWIHAIFDFCFQDKGSRYDALHLVDKKYDREPKRLFLSQGKYTVGILKKFSVAECKFMPTPRMMNLK